MFHLSCYFRILSALESHLHAPFTLPIFHVLLAFLAVSFPLRKNHVILDSDTSEMKPQQQRIAAYMRPGKRTLFLRFSWRDALQSPLKFRG